MTSQKIGLLVVQLAVSLGVLVCLWVLNLRILRAIDHRKRPQPTTRLAEKAEGISDAPTRQPREGENQ